MVCSFFGHSDASEQVYPVLRETIEELITKRGAINFLVGTHGNFDGMVLKALREAKTKHPDIIYNVVLAYMPAEKQEYELYHYSETLLPEGIETAPKRFAISWRNKWMVRESDIVVCYITHSWGGAAQFVKYAKNQGKEIINLKDAE